MNLKDVLLKERPHLKAGSVQNYVICLEKLHQRLHDGVRTFDNLEWLNDHKAVMSEIDKMNDNTKRNYLNSVIVFYESLDDHQERPAWKAYTEMRDHLNKTFADKAMENKKTERQEQNWITMDGFDKVITSYEKLIKRHRILYAKPADIQKDELERLQDYVLLRLYKEIPSRNDFAEVQIVDKKMYHDNHTNEDNYLVTSRSDMYFMLHNWKTKRSEMDSRKIEIPADLRKLLRAYIRKLNGRHFLFANSRGGPLNRNGLTKLFTRLFKRFFPEKNISTSLMRHIFLTDKYADVSKEMKKDQNNLGHSEETQKAYIIDKPSDVM
jgi:site-specific recombinase XerD